ncbi:MAG TPA: carbohydrate ABC transporter permease, partial [Spirochaetia bacterium]|nr:carbohydrate ABC transporter permease [Spirochaetia bacterium]
GFLGTYLGMILFCTALFSPLPIFLLTGYMNTIPLEIEESATMDGATPRHLLQRIVLPMMRPAIATGFIYIFLKVWNDFLSPVYLLAGNTKKYTIVMSLYFFMGQFYTQWNYVFAFLTLVSIPVIIVFIFAQRQIAEGMTAGALKG